MELGIQSMDLLHANKCSSQLNYFFSTPSSVFIEQLIFKAMSRRINFSLPLPVTEYLKTNFPLLHKLASLVKALGERVTNNYFKKKMGTFLKPI